jgi:hypothetical protein
LGNRNIKSKEEPEELCAKQRITVGNITDCKVKEKINLISLAFV